MSHKLHSCWCQRRLPPKLGQHCLLSHWSFDPILSASDDRQTDRSALRADDPPRKIQITTQQESHGQNNSLPTRRTDHSSSQNSLLEGLVEKLDVSSIICEIVTSTREASQLAFSMYSCTQPSIGTWLAASDTTHRGRFLWRCNHLDPIVARADAVISFAMCSSISWNPAIRLEKYDRTERESQTRLSINDHPQRLQQTRSHVVTQDCTA